MAGSVFTPGSGVLHRRAAREGTRGQRYLRGSPGSFLPSGCGLRVCEPMPSWVRLVSVKRSVGPRPVGPTLTALQS